MSALRRRVSDLEAAAPPGGCLDPFHVTWHTVVADMETNELPPRPTCPTCDAPADLVIEVLYERNWRPFSAADDNPAMRRTTVKW